MPTRPPPLTANAWLRYDLVRRALAGRSGDLLEVGCGRGALGARLARQFRYVGLEPDDDSYAIAATRVTEAGGEVRHGDESMLRAGEAFDVVCAFEVLEHIPDDVAALARWAAVLRPGGLLLLSVPAHQDRFAAADVMAGHVRRYDPPVLAERLAGAGLVDVDIRQYGMPLGYALEAARNAVGRRRTKAAAHASLAERTAGSGRLLQPSGTALGFAYEVGTAPFRVLQRRFPDRGTGLVATATKAPIHPT